MLRLCVGEKRLTILVIYAIIVRCSSSTTKPQLWSLDAMSEQVIYKKDIFGIDPNTFKDGPAHLYCYGREAICLHMNRLIWVPNEEVEFSIKICEHNFVSTCTITGPLKEITALANSIQIDCAIFE